MVLKAWDARRQGVIEQLRAVIPLRNRTLDNLCTAICLGLRADHAALTIWDRTVEYRLGRFALKHDSVPRLWEDVALDQDFHTDADLSQLPGFADHPLAAELGKAPTAAILAPIHIDDVTVGTLSVFARAPRDWSVLDRKQLYHATVVADAFIRHEATLRHVVGIAFRAVEAARDAG